MSASGMLPIVVAAAGGLLVCLAALLSGTGIERALLGDSTGALRWGPNLFRVLLAAHGALLALSAVVLARARRREAGHRDLRAAAPRLAGGPADARPWILLGVLSAVALVLRLWRIDSCLWFDEVLTLVDFVRPPLGRIVTTFDSQNQHMLYSVLARASIATFGEHAWTVRLPSVLFGVASLWPVFLLGRRIAGVREGLLACALVAVSYHHVWFSQNARGYMGLMFFATLATWLWLEALSRRAWRWWIAYAAAVALGMWIHLTMAFVPAAHALLYAVRSIRRAASLGVEDPSDACKPIGAWLLAGSLTLQLYALTLPEFLRTALHEVSLPSEWTEPLWVVAESLRSLELGFGGDAAVVAGALVALTGWWSIVRRDWLAGFALVLPAVLGGVTMVALGHNLWPRFFFFSIGFALLIAVNGALTVPRLLLRRHVALAKGAGLAVVGLMLAASVVALPRGYALPKQDFTGARDFVERARQPGEAVVAVGLAGVAYQRYFAPHWLVPQTEAELDAVRRSHSRVWLVYTLPIELRTYRSDVWNVVQKDFEVVKVFPGTLGGGEVNVCKERRSNAGD